MEILTVEEYKNFSPSSPLSDLQVKLYIDLVSDYIKEYLGTDLDIGEVTEIKKGNNLNILYLDKRPVQKILEISSNRGIELHDIVINSSKTGILRVNGIFYQGQDINEPYLASNTTKSEIIKIKYIGGYEVIPNIIKYACIGLIDSFNKEITGEEKNLKSYSRDDVSYTFKDFIERNEVFLQILNRFKPL